jgi:hypothetical protein
MALTAIILASQLHLIVAGSKLRGVVIRIEKQSGG